MSDILQEKVKIPMDQILSSFENQLSNFMEHQAKLAKIPCKINKYKEPIKKQQRYMVNIEKLHKGINDFSKNEPVMIENISKCKAKVDNLQMEIEKYRKKLEDREKYDQDLEKWADFLGFRCTSKDNNLLILEFTKLPIKEYDTVFIFEVECSKLDNFQVLRAKPEGCLDLDQINSERSQYDSNNFNRLWVLICILRKALITKYSA